MRLNKFNLPDYDFESRYVEIEGYRMHYVDEGKGETIMMLHGNPAWSFLYRHLINGLKGAYRCVALDHLGYGLSEKPKRVSYTMRAHIRRLERFVEKVGLKDITMVGQDWGGIIGLGWANKNKNLVKRLVVMNTAGFVPRFGNMKEQRVPPGMPRLLTFKIPFYGEYMIKKQNWFVEKFIPSHIHNRAERINDEVMRGYRLPFPDYDSRLAILSSVRQIPTYPWHPTWKLLKETGKGLEGWNIPTQVIWGMKDPIFREWFIHRFEEMFPNHRETVRIENAGHFLQDDTPEPIIETINSFIKATK